MAVYDQIVTTYSDTTPHIRVISDAIQFIDPRDVPLLDFLGGLDAARSKFNIGGSGTKIEILEDEDEPLATESAGTTTMTSDTTLTDFTVTDASMFQVGHVIMMDAEYMVVSAIDVSGDTISVQSRTYGGTNATHATDEAITIVGQARLEGADASFPAIVDITAPYNYTSIFEKGIQVTGSMQALDQYGISDEFSYQAAKALPERLKLVNRMLYHGVRAAGSATVSRSAGGLGTFVTDNSVNAGGAITKADVDGAMEKCYADGGYPDVLVCNPAVAVDLKDIMDTSSFVRVGQDVSSLGTAPMASVSTQFGNLSVLMDRHCPVAKAYVLDSKKVGVYQYRPFAMQALAITGDSQKGELIGEFSFLVANDKAHAYIYGITS